jgi:hypothetical protein
MAEPSEAMLPKRGRRPATESVFMRIVATAGVVGIGVLVAVIADAAGAKAWAIGLIVSLVTVTLAGVLWSSRQL